MTFINQQSKIKTQPQTSVHSIAALFNYLFVNSESRKISSIFLQVLT